MNLDCTFVAGIVSDIIKHRAEYKKAHNGADLSMTQFLKIYDEEPLEIPDTIGPNKAWYKLVSRPVATTFYTTELIDTDPRFVVDQMRAMCLLNPKKYYVASQLVDMKQ
ncbi:hypothetical protein [Burkholderia sp. PAMC 26561]|uniref:hypothetical protein n=1 Tax=Burkholderia sp. PAMC 26561 TaxID=1795043 RepID=UPI0013C44211|nr:hypothetical protein [Burkholderia sp. PAMC 26561]